MFWVPIIHYFWCTSHGAAFWLWKLFSCQFWRACIDESMAWVNFYVFCNVYCDQFVLCIQTGRHIIWGLYIGQEFWGEIARRYWSSTASPFKRFGEYHSICSHRIFLPFHRTKCSSLIVALPNRWHLQNCTYRRLCNLSSSTTDASHSLLYCLRHFTLYGSLVYCLLLPLLNSWFHRIKIENKNSEKLRKKSKQH